MLRQSLLPEQVALSPDRTRIAYTDGDSNLAVVSVTPPHEPQVVVDSTVAAPVWLSDTDVGFVSHNRRCVFRVDVDGGEDPTVLVDLDEITDALPDEEIYSFDLRGDTLAMVTRIGEWDEDSTASLLVQLDGQWSRPVAHGTKQVLFADIHPSDDLIAVSLDTVITVIDFDRTTTDTVSSSVWVSTSPSWSPSGKQLVWVLEGVGPPYPGTAVLFTTNYPENSDLTPIIGNNGQPFDRLPVFPDW